MTDGRLFIGITTLICVGVFFNGRRYAQMTENPWAGRRILGMPIRGSRLSSGRIRFIGRINMIAALILWLVFVAMSLGFLQTSNISPIRI
jgi:hypothetical protein